MALKRVHDVVCISWAADEEILAIWGERKRGDEDGARGVADECKGGVLECDGKERSFVEIGLIIEENARIVVDGDCKDETRGVVGDDGGSGEGQETSAKLRTQVPQSDGLVHGCRHEAIVDRWDVEWDDSALVASEVAYVFVVV